MGNRAIENRINKLQEIEAQQKALDQEAEKLKEENGSQGDRGNGSRFVRHPVEAGNLFTAGWEGLKSRPS